MEHNDTSTTETSSGLPSVEPFRDEVVGHGGPAPTYGEAGDATGAQESTADVEGHRLLSATGDEADTDVEGHRLLSATGDEDDVEGHRLLSALGERDAREDRQ